jgi:hypothetical protein
MLAPADQTIIDDELGVWGYGLGFVVEEVNDHIWVSHDGVRDGWWALFMAAPELGEGIVILTNYDGHSGRFGWDIIGKWVSWVLGNQKS